MLWTAWKVKVFFEDKLEDGAWEGLRESCFPGGMTLMCGEMILAIGVLFK